jgi:hypothetical protein
MRRLPTTRRQLEHMHPSLPKLNATHRDVEDWYRWFWGRNIADRRPPPSEQVLLYAERNHGGRFTSWSMGHGLKEAMLQIKQDTSFWMREVCESVARQKGNKGSNIGGVPPRDLQSPSGRHQAGPITAEVAQVKGTTERRKGMATQLGQGIPKGCPILSLSFSQEEMPRKLWTFPQLPCAQERMGMQCGRVSTLQNWVGEDSPEAAMWGGVRTPPDHHLEHSDHQDSVKQLLQLCRWLISVPSRLLAPYVESGPNCWPTRM